MSPHGRGRNGCFGCFSSRLLRALEAGQAGVVREGSPHERAAPAAVVLAGRFAERASRLGGRVSANLCSGNRQQRPGAGLRGSPAPTREPSPSEPPPSSDVLQLSAALSALTVRRARWPNVNGLMVPLAKTRYGQTDRGAVPSRRGAQLLAAARAVT